MDVAVNVANPAPNQSLTGARTGQIVRRRPTEAVPRLLRGAHHWWLVGPGGTAKLTDAHVTAGRTLTTAAERTLRAKGVFDSRPFRSYSLTVLTSSRCNLGCDYCFQNTAQDPDGGSRPPRIASVRLASATVTEILDFTRRRMAEAGMESLLLMLFGGEPLLNRRGCLELLQGAQRLGLKRASMTTNGTLLTAPLAVQLADLGLRDVQVTFDGRRSDHDRIRVRRADGQGTFDKITDNLAAVGTTGRIRSDLRVNVTHENHHGIDELIEELAERLVPATASLAFRLVGDVGIGFSNRLALSDVLTASFIRWQTRAVELGFAVSRPGPHTPCQACSFEDGRYGAVVNADGRLASCWETAGRPDWQVGTVRDGYRPRDETAGKWVSCEDLHRYNDPDSAMDRFLDTVDAALLDLLESRRTPVTE